MSAGKYDELFQGGQLRLSDLYKAAQNRPPPPSVRLLSSVPTAPVVFVQPEYPRQAITAHVEGDVAFIVEIDSNGSPTNLSFQSGDPILCAAVKKAASGWRFPPDAISYEVKATIEFDLNCPNMIEER